MKHRFQWYGIFLLVICMTACQVKRPEIVISDADMEDILYDYHIAKAMGENISYDENYKRVLYIESVFKKHGVTQAQFDSSMVWFARYPEVLTKIYEKVNVRLRAERDGINHLIAIRDNKPKESLPGDSIDVWVWQRIYQLTGMPLDNKVSFTIPTDTNFKDRDTLRWTVRFNFHNGVPDANYAPIMAMQILYENDSIVHSIRKVSNPGIQTINLYADTLGKMKEVRGFIYYPTQKASQTLLADRISLMRYHATDTLFHAKRDSIQAIKKIDSLKIDPVQKVKLMEVNEPENTERNVRQRGQIRPHRELPANK